MSSARSPWSQSMHAVNRALQLSTVGVVPEAAIWRHSPRALSTCRACNVFPTPTLRDILLSRGSMDDSAGQTEHPTNLPCQGCPLHLTPQAKKCMLRLNARFDQLLMLVSCMRVDSLDTDAPSKRLRRHFGRVRMLQIKLKISDTIQKTHYSQSALQAGIRILIR